MTPTRNYSSPRRLRCQRRPLTKKDGFSIADHLASVWRPDTVLGGSRPDDLRGKWLGEKLSRRWRPVYPFNKGSHRCSARVAMRRICAEFADSWRTSRPLRSTPYAVISLPAIESVDPPGAIFCGLNALPEWTRSMFIGAHWIWGFPSLRAR